MNIDLVPKRRGWAKSPTHLIEIRRARFAVSIPTLKWHPVPSSFPPSLRHPPLPHLSRSHPAHMISRESSPSVATSRIQNHPPTPFSGHSEILLDDCISPPLFSPPLCDLDVPPASHPFLCEPAPPAHETTFTSLEPESLLLSYGDQHYPPLHLSPPSPISLPIPMSDELCSINYSPRFPHGHYLNPAFARAYILGDELGSGGYGFVMTALDRRHKSEVAVKFVIKTKVPEQAWISHDTSGIIPMEIMLLRIINHENIVKCLDVFEDELFFYVVSFRVLSPC